MNKRDLWRLGLVVLAVVGGFVAGEGVVRTVDGQVKYMQGAEAYHFRPDQEFNTWGVETGPEHIAFGRMTGGFHRMWSEADENSFLSRGMTGAVKIPFRDGICGTVGLVVQKSYPGGRQEGFGGIGCFWRK